MTENDNLGKVHLVSDFDLVALLRVRVEVPLDEMGGSGDISSRRLSEIRLILYVLRDLQLISFETFEHYQIWISDFDLCGEDESLLW